MGVYFGHTAYSRPPIEQVTTIRAPPRRWRSMAWRTPAIVGSATRPAGMAEATVSVRTGARAGVSAASGDVPRRRATASQDDDGGDADDDGLTRYTTNAATHLVLPRARWSFH